MPGCLRASVQSSADDDFLPEFPGEDAYKHDGMQYKENEKALLGKRGLLAVAYGDPRPPSCVCCIHRLPNLATSCGFRWAGSETV